MMRSLSPLLMRYAFELSYEFNCYKLINYLILDHVLLRAIQENTLDEFIRYLKRFSDPCNGCMQQQRVYQTSLKDRFTRSIYTISKQKCIQL
jgi:hypothetical protein